MPNTFVRIVRPSTSISRCHSTTVAARKPAPSASVSSHHQRHRAHVAAFERRDAAMDRQAARQECDRRGNRRVQHIVRARTAEALARVEQVGHDEDREDRGLGGDQARHAHLAAQFDHRSGFAYGFAHGGAHSYFQSGSSGCFRSHSGRRLWTDGISAKLYAGGGEVVVHSSVHASHGSSPGRSPRSDDDDRLATKTDHDRRLERSRRW